MHKKKLCMALSALSVLTASDGVTSERAGVAAVVNTSVEQLSTTRSRVLFVGSDIFRDETIRTDDSGQTHLMFLDQSSLTIGPNSELVIDNFVYDPVTNSGELSMSAKKGILRLVGGALSKTGNGVLIKTPVGNLGIRGAVVLVDIAEDGTTTAHLIYGNELNFTNLDSNTTHRITEHEHGIKITPDGRVEVGLISSEALHAKISRLQSPKSSALTPQVIASQSHPVTLPDNHHSLLRQLSSPVTWDRLRNNETFNAAVVNRDIEHLAS